MAVNDFTDIILLKHFNNCNDDVDDGSVLYIWFLFTFPFFCQLCVHLTGGSVVNTGLEGMTCMRKERSLGRQTTVHLDLSTGTPDNQTTTTTTKTVCYFVRTGIGETVPAMRFGHTSVKSLQCKQCNCELRWQLSYILSQFESTNAYEVYIAYQSWCWSFLMT